MTAGMPLLASDVWDVITNPNVILIVLVVIVGIVNAISKGAKKMMERQAGGRPQARREEFKDPEELLPDFLRPKLWKEAQDRGVVEADPSPPPPPPQRPDPPVKRERVELMPIAAPPIRKKRRRARSRDAESDAVSGRRLHDTPAAESPHAPVRTHGQLGIGQPSRRTVREAVMWAEVLAPPRALRPYRSPTAARSEATTPSALGILPLPPSPPDSGER